MNWSQIGTGLAEAGIYTFAGLVLFAVAYMLISAAAPFDVKKELSEDDNTAVGVMLAGVFIGIGLVIAASIMG
jgi:uncharacterized membrane protein YjfL (UPF0719 family)